MRPSVVATVPLVMLLASCADAPRPPAVPRQVQLVSAPTWGNCILSWGAPDVSVDGYDLKVSPDVWEFADRGLGAIPGDATSTELDFASGGNPELTQISVAIRARRGKLVSEYSESVSCKLPIRPPVEVMAVVTGNGVAVSWRSFSALALSFQIERSELDAARHPGAWAPIGSVINNGGLEFSYSDTGASVVGKAYGYRVTAIASADRSEGSETATLVLGAPLLETMIQLPRAIMVTDGLGHYAYAMTPQGLPSDIVYVWGDGQTWTSVDAAGLASPGVIFLPGGIKLDASGLPHVVYSRPQASGSVQILHGWPDGTQWREETIAVRGSSITPSSTQMFDLDTSGNPMIVWVSGGKLEAASKRAGAWEVTSLQTVYPNLSAIQTSYVFADQTGTVHFLVGEQQAIRHLQPQNGVWTSETLPMPPRLDLDSDSRVLGVGYDPDHLAVFVPTRSAPDFISTVPHCLRKTPSGWSLESLGVLPFFGGAGDYLVALSSDGRRLALLSQPGYPYDSHLFRSDDGGSWSETIVSPLDFATPGFTRGGKFQVFSYRPENWPSGSGPLVPYLVEIEP